MRIGRERSLGRGSCRIGWIDAGMNWSSLLVSVPLQAMSVQREFDDVRIRVCDSTHASIFPISQDGASLVLTVRSRCK